MVKIGVFDCESTKAGDLVLTGYYDRDGYLPFTDIGNFLTYLDNKQVKQVWCHNIEFDFFKLREKCKHFKFMAYFNGAGNITYIEVGSTKHYFKDLHNHLPLPLREVGELINLPKLSIDYNKIKRVNSKLLDYNKRDCEITYKAVVELDNLYTKLGCNKIGATVGANAMNLWCQRFNGMSLCKPIPVQDLDTWRFGYKGGWVECFRQGAFTGTFYKIDINSLFPLVMRTSYPSPYDFYYKAKTLGKHRYRSYWLGVIEHGLDEPEIINSVEDNDLAGLCDYYYIFPTKIWPFREYVDYLNPLKESAESKFYRTVYKLLMNALYGKFGQRAMLDCVTNYNIKSSKRVIGRVNWVDGLDRVIYDLGYKPYVNIVWSLFTTAKARRYMFNLYRIFSRRGLTVYYIDTDSFIVSGDISKIAKSINSSKLGLFKLEGTTESIDIRGKKQYRFGNDYTCKGIPRDYRQEFFDKGEVQFDKMVRYKEGLQLGKPIGSWVTVKKTDVQNKRGNNAKKSKKQNKK